MTKPEFEMYVSKLLRKINANPDRIEYRHEGKTHAAIFQTLSLSPQSYALLMKEIQCTEFAPEGEILPELSERKDMNYTMVIFFSLATTILYGPLFVQHESKVQNHLRTTLETPKPIAILLPHPPKNILTHPTLQFDYEVEKHTIDKKPIMYASINFGLADFSSNENVLS
jgi:hypothetical protein